MNGKQSPSRTNNQYTTKTTPAAMTPPGEINHPRQEQVRARQRRKPFATRLRQQKLPGCKFEAFWTLATAAPIYFLIGLILFAIGIAWLVHIHKLGFHFHEEFDYTDCYQVLNGVRTPHHCKTLVSAKAKCKCEVSFSIKKPAFGDVTIFYGLSNFFHNYRRFVSSRSDQQYEGYLEEVSHYCAPKRKTDEMRFDKNISSDGSEKLIAPCGAVANALFNDSYILYRERNSDSRVEVPLTYEGIVWPEERKHKFVNPENISSDFKDYIKPPFWSKPINQLSSDPNNNGFLNSDFIIWMRTESFPEFRKPWRKVDRSNNSLYSEGLPVGNYTIEIDYKYRVDQIDAFKRVIISSMDASDMPVGGRRFLAFAYTIVGSFLMCLSGIMALIHFTNRQEFLD